MATLAPVSLSTQIGNVAGKVWNVLAQEGTLSISKLVKTVGEPRDLVMQALGWLAREEKISIEEDGRRRRVVSLI